MPVLNEYGDAEYRMEAAVKRIIREIDPYRLMFGSIVSRPWLLRVERVASWSLLRNVSFMCSFVVKACGETWYWTEEGAGLGMDVMMKEGYGGSLTIEADHVVLWLLTLTPIMMQVDR